MLVRADALENAGGIASIRNALIDDCSLAEKLKKVGPVWLGLTDRARSIRPYDTLAGRRMDREVPGRSITAAPKSENEAAPNETIPRMRACVTGIGGFWLR